MSHNGSTNSILYNDREFTAGDAESSETTPLLSNVSTETLNTPLQSKCVNFNVGFSLLTCQNVNDRHHVLVLKTCSF